MGRMTGIAASARLGMALWRGIGGGALAGAALLAAGAAAPLAAAEGGTLVVARDMDLNSLDPARTWCDTCQIYVGAAYERLVGLSPDNTKIVPQLARSWEINDDQTVFTFHLDPRAKFADGSPVEAKDVKWSWERLKNVKGGASILTNGIKGIETPDARTVVVTLEKPDSEFLGRTTHGYLLVTNSTLLKEHGGSAEPGADAKDTAEAWLLKNSAGSGPYVLESYRPQDELRLKRNDAYWGPRPQFAEIVLKESKDAVSQAQMLQNGTADIGMQIDMETAKSIAGDKIVIDKAPSFSYVYLALSPGAKNLSVPLTPKIREAIGYAIDYDGLIDVTVAGAGRKQPSPIPNDFPGTAGLPAPVYDPAKAKALLAEAGVPNGFAMVAAYPNLNTFGVDMSLMMQKVQGDLAKVGIALTLQPVTFAIWRDRIQGDGIPLTAVFYTPGYLGTGVYVQYFSMMPGSVWSKRAGADRDPSILNPRIADLYKNALASGGAKRDGYYHEIALEMIKERIILPMVNPDILMVHRKGIEGVRYSICCLLPVAEISGK